MIFYLIYSPLFYEYHIYLFKFNLCNNLHSFLKILIPSLVKIITKTLTFKLN